MRFDKVFFVSFILMAILMIGAVSADENTTDALTIDESPQLGNAEDVQPLSDVSKISDYEYRAYIPDYVCSGSIGTISVSDMPKNATGNVSISVDGVEKYNQKLSFVKNALLIDNLNPDIGMHEAVIRYSGDDCYDGFTYSGDFEYNYLIMHVPKDVMLNSKNSYVQLESVKGLSGDISVMVDGNLLYSHTFKKEKVQNKVSLNDLALGEHTYEFTYSNGNYEPITKKGSFNISYYFNATIEGNNEIVYGNSSGVYIDMSTDSISLISVKINGRNISFNKLNNHEISLSDFDMGNNTITFSYFDGIRLNEVTRNLKVLPNLDIPPVQSYQDAKLALTMPDTYSGNLNVMVDGENYKSCNLTDGKAEILFNDLAVGWHVVTFDYHGDYEDYLPAANYTIDIIPKVPTKIRSDGTYNLSFLASDDINGDLILKGIINATVQVINGSASIPLTDLKDDDYVLEATYKDFNWNFNISVYHGSRIFKMELIYPKKLHLNAGYYHDPDSSQYVFDLNNVPRDARGTFTLYHDGKYLGQAIPDRESGKVIYPNFSLGNHTITVCYSGDEYYLPVNETFVYEVVHFLCSTPYKDELTVLLDPSSTGSITVNADGNKIFFKKIIGNDDEGYSYHTIPLKGIPYGNVCELEVILNDQRGHFVEKINYTPYYSFYARYYEYDDSIEIRLPYGVENNPTVNIDGKKYDYVKSGDYYCVDVSKCSLGNHEVVVNYPGDANYPQKSINMTFEKRAYITISENHGRYSNKGNFSLKLPDDAVGNLTVELSENGNDFKVFKSVPVKNGEAIVDFHISKIGEYEFRSYFDGNYPVEGDSTYFTIYPKFKYRQQMEYSETQDVIISMDDQTTGRVVVFPGYSGIPVMEIDVDSKNNKITLNKTFFDKIRIFEDYYSWDEDDFIDLKIGFYFNGKMLDACYVSVVHYSKLIAKDLTMQYGDGSTFDVRVYDRYGDVAKNQIVTFKIDSKKYYAKTDSNGIAKLKIKNVPNTYTITTSFDKESILNTVTVKHILSIKTVKVKRSAKKLVLTATLKKIKGKYLKGKKITFKFNGKKYTAKTNKKGVAKVTVKKSVLKKLRVGKKVTYQATYLKDTVKKSVKVKK